MLAIPGTFSRGVAADVTLHRSIPTSTRVKSNFDKGLQHRGGLQSDVSLVSCERLASSVVDLQSCQRRRFFPPKLLACKSKALWWYPIRLGTTHALQPRSPGRLQHATPSFPVLLELRQLVGSLHHDLAKLMLCCSRVQEKKTWMRPSHGLERRRCLCGSVALRLSGIRKKCFPIAHSERRKSSP